MVTEPVADHGEGPVWDGVVVHFVDMMAGAVLSFDPDDGSVTRWQVDDVVAALRPRVAGGFVIATERGFAVADHAGGEARPVAKAFDDPAVRMNDGGCDPQGRFYCGTMAYDLRAGGGSLYRLDPDGSVHVVLEGATISNGLVWSLDGGTVYYVDTPTQRIDAFDFEAGSGRLSNRRPSREPSSACPYVTA